MHNKTFMENLYFLKYFLRKKKQKKDYLIKSTWKQYIGYFQIKMRGMKQL